MGKVVLLIFIGSWSYLAAAQTRDKTDISQVAAVRADSSFQAKGNLKRSYFFAEAKQKIPYRIYVPASWNGKTKLPVILMLHGGGENEDAMMDKNDKQLLRLAEKHGYLVVSPLGYTRAGAYGSYLRLPAVFGKTEDQEKQRALVDSTKARTLALSEKDVINVLDLVVEEYKADKENIFLAGHSMGSGGTWYLGAKYSSRWCAMAPMSGPFIDQSSYPFDKMKSMPIFVTEGIQTPTIESSRLLAAYMKENKFDYKYMEVDASHGGMIPLVLPAIFEYFDSQKKK